MTLIPTMLDGSHTYNAAGSGVTVTLTDPGNGYEAAIAAGDAINSLWWLTDEGRMDYVAFTGDFDIVAANVGLKSGSNVNQFQFVGLVCWLAPLDYEFAVAGNRGGTGNTVEYKSTLDGSSQQGDIGANALTGGHCDLRVARVGSTVTFYWRQVGGTTWTTLPHSSHSTRPSFGTGEVRIGLVTYGYTTVDAFVGEVEQVYVVTGDPEDPPPEEPPVAIDDIAVNFYGGTPAAIATKTFNDYAGGAAGQLSANLLGYNTGAGTGVAFNLGSARTGDNNGRLAGATTLIQEMNRQMAYASSLGPHTDFFTLPAGVLSCTVIVHCCISTYSNQLIDFDVNGQSATAWNPITNTAGDVLIFTGVVPDGSNRVNITFTDTDTTLPYVGINGYMLTNIVTSAPNEVSGSVGVGMRMAPASSKGVSVTTLTGVSGGAGPGANKGTNISTLIAFLHATGVLAASTVQRSAVASVKSRADAAGASGKVVSTLQNLSPAAQATALKHGIADGSVVLTSWLGSSAITLQSIAASVRVTINGAGSTAPTPATVDGMVGIALAQALTSTQASVATVLLALNAATSGGVVAQLSAAVQQGLLLDDVGGFGIGIELTASAGLSVTASAGRLATIAAQVGQPLALSLEIAPQASVAASGLAAFRALGEALAAAHFNATGQQLLIVDIEASEGVQQLVLATPEGRVIKIKSDDRVIRVER